jgi:hypothetical protein
LLASVPIGQGQHTSGQKCHPTRGEARIDFRNAVSFSSSTPLAPTTAFSGIAITITDVTDHQKQSQQDNPYQLAQTILLSKFLRREKIKEMDDLLHINFRLAGVELDLGKGGGLWSGQEPLGTPIVQSTSL